MKATELAYRKTAAHGATGFGLLIALYDTLAGDLGRAAEAERDNNIEKRCEAINHALLVVAHLEDWVKLGNGGELTNQLVAFYHSLRRNMLKAQAERSPEVLEQQIVKVLEIRRVWQDLDHRRIVTTEVPSWVPDSAFVAAGSPPLESTTSGWSA